MGGTRVAWSSSSPACSRHGRQRPKWVGLFSQPSRTSILSLGSPRWFFCYKAPMPPPLLVLLFDFLQLFNCLIFIFAVHITLSPTQWAPVLDIVPSHLTSPPNRLVDSGILPQRLHNTWR